MPTTKGPTRAFTLIEVVVAGAILAAGAAAILTSYFTLMGVAEHQRRLSTAVHVTQGKLEEVLNASASADILTGDHTFVVDAVGQKLALSAYPAADSYFVTCSVAANTPSAGHMTATITTEWTETRGTRSTQYVVVRDP